MKTVSLHTYKLIFAIILLVLCGLIAILIAVPAYKEHSAIEQMDANELHYDASGFLILVDKQENLLGIYSGNVAMKHYFIDVDTWPVLHRPTTLNELHTSYGIEINQEILSYIGMAYIPVDTPVLVYDYN